MWNNDIRAGKAVLFILSCVICKLLKIMVLAIPISLHLHS